MKNKDSKWVSISFSRTRFKWGFRLFGNDISFRISKRQEYSNKSNRMKPIIKALRKGEIGELYGVRFISNDSTS